MLPARPFGNTGLTVSALGLGAGELGDPSQDERGVEALLRVAIDRGITLIDTARSYGLSEQRIGRMIAPVRDSVVLSTKVGYSVEGVADWTGDAVRLGIDEALAVMATDRIEIVHLHSCPIDVLERGEVITALVDAKRAGKLRSAAYSGDNEALVWAAASGAFDSLQMSWNLCDQRAAGVITRASAAGLGVIAKRPLANAPWRFADRPVGQEAEKYWERWRTLALDPGGLAWDELALRFAVHFPGVSAAIVGTRQLAHLLHNAGLAARGPLPDAHVGELRARFQSIGADWPSQI